MAHRQGPGDHQVGSPPDDQQRGDLAEKARNLIGDIVEVLGAKGCSHIVRQLLLPAALYLWLDGLGFHCLHSRHRLGQEGLVGGAVAELVIQALFQDRGNNNRQGDIAGQRAQHDPGERRAVVPQYREEHEGKGQVYQQRQGAAGDEIANGLQLSHPRHGLPHLARLEVSQWQSRQVMKHAGTQFHVHPVAGVTEQVVAQAPHHGVESHHHDEAKGQHVQCGKALVYQHLVHHHLEEQWCHQREQLQEKGGNDHLGKEAPVLDK